MMRRGGHKREKARTGAPLSKKEGLEIPQIERLADPYTPNIAAPQPFHFTDPHTSKGRMACTSIRAERRPANHDFPIGYPSARHGNFRAEGLTPRPCLVYTSPMVLVQCPTQGEAELRPPLQYTILAYTDQMRPRVRPHSCPKQAQDVVIP